MLLDPLRGGSIHLRAQPRRPRGIGALQEKVWMMFSRATYDGPTRLDAPWLCIEEHWAGESALGIPRGISLALFTTHDENRFVTFMEAREL